MISPVWAVASVAAAASFSNSFSATTSTAIGG